MTLGSARVLPAALAALLLAACASNVAANTDFVAERDAARAYIVSDVAEAAAAEAVADIRRAAAAEDRALIDAYLADPAHARRLPAQYQDYLIDALDAAEIGAMTAWSGDPAAFERQVAMHRDVLARSLIAWHIGEAGLDPATAADDRLVTTLAALIRTAPGPLVARPQQG